MISARSSAPALVLPLTLVLAAGLVGPAAASATEPRTATAGATSDDAVLTLRPLPSRTPGATAQVAAASATASISSCFVLDQQGTTAVLGELFADPAAATAFDILVTSDFGDIAERVVVGAGEALGFSILMSTGPVSVTVSSEGAVLTQTSRTVADCTPAPSTADYGADEIVRWNGYGDGFVVSTLTDGNTEPYDVLRENPGNDTGTAVLVPVQLDGVPGEELMSYDP
uniref:hypothetical protein n=1 Tax=Aquipuribacter nitratireducens TaxID=650104 RepID=UPI0030ED3C41